MIPGGSDWKATFMLEYDDAEERRAALARMIGIESRVWVQVAAVSENVRRSLAADLA